GRRGPAPTTSQPTSSSSCASSATTTDRPRAGSSALGGAEACVEIGQDVLDRLEADAQTDQARVGATGQLLLLGELAVGRARRVDDETADVADVGHVAVQLERLDEALPRLLAAL